MRSFNRYLDVETASLLVVSFEKKEPELTCRCRISIYLFIRFYVAVVQQQDKTNIAVRASEYLN